MVFEAFFIRVSNTNAAEVQSRGRALVAIFLFCFQGPGNIKLSSYSACVCVRANEVNLRFNEKAFNNCQRKSRCISRRVCTLARISHDIKTV